MKHALILGCSSGFGAATVIELAKHNFTIFGVHLDRKATLENVEQLKKQAENLGAKVFFFNKNAASLETIQEVTKFIKEELDKSELPQEEKKIDILLHSLAFGSLKEFFPSSKEEAIKKEQLEMTLDVMANSLVYWVQELFYNGLLKNKSRIFAMTSAGSVKVWKGYGAVSAAKCALESYIRQIALELAPYGITANALRAGVTETPALKKIPGWEVMLEKAKTTNPSGRATTPEDIAKAIYALSLSETQWMTGNVIGIDGGEMLV
jgi:NAD(P)-dependent dehydrogenase (short-subunit alcohol dehydrogenase family)